MTNHTDTNQASEALEAKLNTIIFARFYDIPGKQRSTVVKNLRKLIRTEKLKLLAEVRERVVGNIVCTCGCNFRDGCLCLDKYELRTEQYDLLNKLEAEL